MTKKAEKLLESLEQSMESSAVAVADHLRTVADNGLDYATNKAIAEQAESVMEWASQVATELSTEHTKVKGKLCHEAFYGMYGLRLYQTGIDRFTVVYGKQVKEDLDYFHASMEYGQCIFHKLACDDRLDNRDKGER